MHRIAESLLGHGLAWLSLRELTILILEYWAAQPESSAKSNCTTVVLRQRELAFFGQPHERCNSNRSLEKKHPWPMALSPSFINRKGLT